MNYLLDTCVIRDFIKGEKNTLDRFKYISPDKIAISSITVMELKYGLALNPGKASLIEPIITDLISAIFVLDFNQKDAELAAKIRALLKKKGRPIGAYALIFVTSNTRVHICQQTLMNLTELKT